MKKTFHPLDRTKKASQIFKKKTLGVNDNLNIKHDSDDIENIGDYWDTAVSVIGNNTIDSIDDTIISENNELRKNKDNDEANIEQNESVFEQSDTLFNINDIRKSIKENNKPQTVTAEYSKPNLIKKVKPQKLYKTTVDSSKKIEYEIPFNEIEDLKPKKKDIINLNKVKEFDILEIEKDLVQKGEMEAINRNEFIDYESIQLDNSVGSISDSNKITIKLPQRNKEFSPFFDVQNIQNFKNPDIFHGVICSLSMETSIWKLSSNSFTEKYKTENTFSLFVLKGKIEMTVDSVTKILKRHDISIIEKNNSFSIRSLCKDGGTSDLLLTYLL